MEPITYTVRQIDGDYAHLVDEKGIELLMARALLPEATDEGSKLLYKDYQYRLL